MLLGLNHIDLTTEEYLAQCADLVSDKKTLVFLDTNILAYLYKLHEAARKEFHTWLASLKQDQRLFIPSWAATEYLSRVKSKKLKDYTPSNADPDQLKKTLERLLENVTLFLDDTVLQQINYARTKQEFMDEFRETVKLLTQYTRVFNHQFQPENVHEEIVGNLSNCVLNSDVAALCEQAAKEGPIRIEHRIPPAFKDANKPENRFGDLIIWYEIMAHTKTLEGFDKVLFITNDEKADWVYQPKFKTGLQNSQRKKIANKDIKVIDPQLTAEFSRQVGHNNIHIATLSTLIEGLSKKQSAYFTQLAAAIQIESAIALEKTAESVQSGEALSSVAVTDDSSTALDIQELAMMQELEQATTAITGSADSSDQPTALESETVDTAALTEASSAAAEPAPAYPADALSDSQYLITAASAIDKIIEDLRVHNWYIQNPAIDRIKQIRAEPFDPAAWFVLGRNIYQAACGNALKAISFIGSLNYHLTYFPAETADHLLAGMTYEIYFDHMNQLRTDIKSEYMDEILLQLKDPVHHRAARFVNSCLPADTLLYTPGSDTTHAIIVSLSVLTPATESANATYEIESITTTGNSLLHDRAADSTDSPLYSCTPKNIKKLLSSHLKSPKWALDIAFEPVRPTDSSKLKFPADKAIHL